MKPPLSTSTVTNSTGFHFREKSSLLTVLPEQKSRVEAGGAQPAQESAPKQEPTLPSSTGDEAMLGYTIRFTELTFGKLLGQGGYGKVFTGKWKFNEVAIKQYTAQDFSEQTRQEICKEAKVMATVSIKSDYLVQLRGVVLEKPHYSLVMEYLPGGDLFHLLRSSEILTWPRRYQLALNITIGLHHLHQDNILHRDLKSPNVLLDGSGRAKLADFGLSTLKTSSASTTSGFKGTVLWSAPELFKPPAKATMFSDIYSLGVVLWELASRKIPFADAPNPAIATVWVMRGGQETVPKETPEEYKQLIEDCWDKEPSKRPAADAVAKRLDDLLQEHKGEEKAFPVTDSLDKAKLEPHRAEEVKEIPRPALKPVDQTALSQLLQFVAEGEQDEAEALIQKDKELLLEAGTVKDLSGREFKQITAFQYALWALDWHMWTMIQKYLPKEAQKKQCQALEEKGTAHGKHFNLYDLIDALQTYVDNQKSWSLIQREDQWYKVVGGEQKLLPAHIVNEYCRPDRQFDPCPSEWESKLPRIREVDIWDNTQCTYVKGSWFIPFSSKDTLGLNYAFLRNWERACGVSGKLLMYSNSDLCWVTNLKALRSLWQTRVEQLQQKLDQLELLTPKLKSALNLSQLLRFVAEGEQDKAEALIQKDKDLLLQAGTVRDLSDREFKQITAFQYALWALDWHMWTMIQKYLPKETQAEQFQALYKEGTAHSRHFSLQCLMDVMQTFLDDSSKWSYQQSKDHWCQVIGREQKLLPAHVVNEYCRPDRGFNPCPVEWKSKLPRTRVVTVWDKGKSKDGYWFISPTSKDSLERSYAFYRGHGVQGEAMSVCEELSDLKALQSLWKTRTRQVELLGFELLSVLNQRQMLGSPLKENHSVDQKALSQLLQYVAEGEQDKAEVLIQKDKNLLLYAGTVEDLSGREFKQITAFQYALWALDWHMWTMIQKYLPKKAQAEQFRALKHEGTEHDNHFSMEGLIDALQRFLERVEGSGDSNNQLTKSLLCKLVGGEQKLLPAHVVNEYCRPDRAFAPCPLEWKSKLPRTRAVKVWDSIQSKTVDGYWFIPLSPEDSLGMNYAFMRSGNDRPLSCGGDKLFTFSLIVMFYRTDLEALQSLWRKRTQQLEQLELSMPMPKFALKPVDQTSLGQLLQLVAEGEQYKAEALIQKDKNLLLHAGTVKDLSGREFKSITAFQYALWALDWYMWTMIQKYLRKDVQMEQLQALENKGTAHGRHFSLKFLINALQTYVDNIDIVWKDDQQAENYWCKVVGGEQKLLPTHIVNEYCRPDRVFEPRLLEWEVKLTRTRAVKVWDSTKEERVNGSWYIPPSSKDGLGISYAFLRYDSLGTVALDSAETAARKAVMHDLKALQSLWNTRTQQLELLMLPKSAITLSQLLQWVAEGEQCKAEALIQKDKNLLLQAGTVKDLSGREFKQITAFQYALWALDWHMWTMIQKYLPEEAQAEQYRTLEEKGTAHGNHFSLKGLLDALHTYVCNVEKVWDYDQRAEDHWNKVVGGAQKELPAHIVNEYCRPDRSFCPCPSEWESKLPRTRVVKVWDSTQLKKVDGSWFISPSPKDAISINYAFYRHRDERANHLKVRRGGWALGNADLQALQSLWKTRMRQLKLLGSELLSVPTNPVLESSFQESKKLTLLPSLSESSQTLIPKQKSALKPVDQTALSQLLQFVAEGEQDKAEALIQKDKNLLLHAGMVKDLSAREFKSITVFQYALWAMDWHMWTMIQKYLPETAQAEQCRVLEEKGTAHGNHFSLKGLFDALQTYMDNAEKIWLYGEGAKSHWHKVVGGEQKQLPAHVVNEYCRPDRAFEPCPSEWESKLTRTRELEIWDSARSEYVKGSWFIPSPSKEALGLNHAFSRHTMRQAAAMFVGGLIVGLEMVGPDLKALQSLWETRTKQLQFLKSQLLSATSKNESCLVM